MKTFKLFFLILLMIFLFSCDDEKGTTTQSLNGDEQGLPDELKGMKLYYVSMGKDAGGIYVAKLPNNTINAVSFLQSKTQTATIIINERTIVAKEIIAETADIIVIRK